MDDCRRVVQKVLATARLLSDKLDATGYFSCLSDMHVMRISKRVDLLHVLRFLSFDSDYLVVFPCVIQDYVWVHSVFQCMTRKFPSQVSPSAPDKNAQVIIIHIPDYTIPSKGTEGHDTEIMRIVVREYLTPDLVKTVLSGLVHVAKT